MKITAKFVRKQLEFLKPVITGCSLSAARTSQAALGELIARAFKKEETQETVAFSKFESKMITPACLTDEDSVILYLHGGGYVAGNIDYAKGVGSVIAVKTGLRTFCPAYRLAPEHPFPAALKDALTAYRYLVKDLNIAPGKIILLGESAGGGLVYSLCLRLRETNRELPAGIVALSPWTDLTQSGSSYELNKDADPSMTADRLKYFADCYTDNISDPLVSPLFGELRGMPPSLIFSGGDEIMLDDARIMHEKLLHYGCESRHIIKPGMWHVYILYGLEEHLCDYDEICSFVKEKTNNGTKSEMDESGQRRQDFSGREAKILD